MATTESKVRPGLPRTLVAGAAVAAIVAGVGSFYFRGPSVPAGPVTAGAATAEAEAVPVGAGRVPAAPAVAAAAPSFDVVRVSPQGSAVIAGRAEPGAEVIVRDGAQEIARTKADARGAFVAIPTAPLPEGGRSLTLGSRGEGQAEVKSDGAVMVVVPAAPSGTDAVASGAAPAPAPSAPAVVAVLVPSVAAPHVMQDAKPVQGAAVALDTVDYDESGSIRFTGRAAAGSALRVYVDNGSVGDAIADAAGRWMLMPSQGVVPGVHTLRVDRLDAGGRVVARVELPFSRASIPVAELASGRIVVQPGQNLWRMARSAYGSGVRYTVIYLANKDQIRDPRLIYPGQAFAVPASAR